MEKFSNRMAKEENHWKICIGKIVRQLPGGKGKEKA
jgi:hypothetical protein